MDEIQLILDKVGVPADTLAIAAGLVYLLAEWIKAKFPGFFEGTRTQLLAGSLSVGLSILLLQPNWLGVAVMAPLVWLLPESVHQARYAKEKKAKQAGS